jgi:subtilisin family serine protease
MRNLRLQTIIALGMLVMLMAVGIWPATAQEMRPTPGPGVELKPGEVLVEFKHEVSAQSTHALLTEVGATRVRTLYGSRVELWQVPEGQELAIAKKLTANPAVEYAEPNYRYYALDSGPNTPVVEPSDPYFNRQWGHAQIQSAAAWDITTGSADVVIAIIDSGVDLGHPDLAGKLVAGRDFVDGDDSPWDTNGHGSHVAGIAAAVTNNGTGIAGVDWQAKIMPVRVLTDDGGGYSSVIAEGVRWAAQEGAQVLNLSLGGSSYSQTLRNAIMEAHQKGSLVVAAMGNSRLEGNPTQYPAAYDHVMAVAATGPSDLYARYSQYGDHCDISAPGGDMFYLHDPDGVYSTMPTYPVYMTINEGFSRNYDYAHGTSQAAPHVAGLAALVWGLRPSLTPDEVQTMLEATADDLGEPGWDMDYGYGRINAWAAVQGITPPSVPTLYAIQNTGGQDDFVVKWTAVSGATSYSLEENADPSFLQVGSMFSVTVPQYQVTNKEPGTTWYYRVRANNAQGNSAWSNVESTTVAPAAPVLEAIENTGNEDEYVVQWSATTGAISYTLGESNGSSCKSPTIRYKGAALQYQVTGQRGGTWYYCVRASNAGGDSGLSAVVSTTVTMPALEPPKMAPIDNAGGDNAYVVEWSPVPTSPITYTLEQSGNPYFVGPTVVYSGTAVTHTVEGQPAGTWYYRVRAFGQDGKSPWSESESVTVGVAIFLPLAVVGYPVALPLDPWTVIIREDFEGIFPKILWDIEDVSGAGYQWGTRDCRPHAGAYSAWAIGNSWNGGGPDCFSSYPNGTESWLVYGPFNLEDATEAELRYQAWVNVQDKSGDALCHMASIDNYDFYGWCTSFAFPQQTWTERVLDLTDVYELGDLIGEPQVWVLLLFQSDLLGNASEGAYVDDVLLRKMAVPPTAADVEGQAGPPPGWQRPAVFRRTG